MDVILSFFLHDMVTDKFHQPNIKIDLKLMGMDSDTCAHLVKLSNSENVKIHLIDSSGHS